MIIETQQRRVQHWTSKPGFKISKYPGSGETRSFQQNRNPEWMKKWMQDKQYIRLTKFQTQGDLRTCAVIQEPSGRTCEKIDTRETTHMKSENKKLIRRWDSGREFSLRRHRARTTKYNRLVHKFRHRSTRLRVGTHVYRIQWNNAI